MHQIITRNSKNDSSPICRYREEGAQVADMGSTENKRAKSFKEKKKKKPMQWWWWLLLVCFRERKTVFGGGDRPRHYSSPPFHSIPPLSPLLVCFSFYLNLCLVSYIHQILSINPRIQISYQLAPSITLALLLSFFSRFQRIFEKN